MQLYSRYTNGPQGQFSTEDGFITVVDIPLVLGVAVFPSNGSSPPVGMVPFDAHSGSQENSLSFDQYPQHGTDDLLIVGSLSEIGTHETTKWEANPLPNNSSHHRNGIDESQSQDKEWYQQDEEENLYSPPQDKGQSSSGHNSSSQVSDIGNHTPQGRRHKVSWFEPELAMVQVSVLHPFFLSNVGSTITEPVQCRG